MSAGIITGTTTAGGGLTLMARLRGQDGQLVTQTSLTGISYQITDLLAGAVASSGMFGVAATIFDSPVTNDPRWTADSAAQPGDDGAWGYSFLAQLPAGTFPPTVPGGPALTPAPARNYQIDVKFSPVSGAAFYAVFQCLALPVYF